jgi:hypothetical protein
MPILYFAKDGSYGDAKNLITITTTNWDSHMMDSIKNVPDESRASFAQALRNNIHDLEPGSKSKLGCIVCTDLFAAL